MADRSFTNKEGKNRADGNWTRNRKWRQMGKQTPLCTDCSRPMETKATSHSSTLTSEVQTKARAWTLCGIICVLFVWTETVNPQLTDNAAQKQTEKWGCRHWAKWASFIVCVFVWWLLDTGTQMNALMHQFVTLKEEVKERKKRTLKHCFDGDGDGDRNKNDLRSVRHTLVHSFDRFGDI